MNTIQPTIQIITDCIDPDAVTRQTARWSSFFNGANTNLIPLSNSTIDTVDFGTTLGAAGLLIDSLDAIEDRHGIVAVNSAPRHSFEGKKEWENGTPFGYFWYKDTLVVASVDGYVLSLVKKLGLTDSIHIMNIPDTYLLLEKAGYVDENRSQDLLTTQFRSYEFLPRVGAYLWRHKEITSKEHNLAELCKDISGVWYIDGFGNIKITHLKSDLDITSNNTVITKFGELPFYENLKDVPHGETAVIVGSSGIDTRRFVEIVVQGKPASEVLGVKVGDEIFDKLIY